MYIEIQGKNFKIKFCKFQISEYSSGYPFRWLGYVILSLPLVIPPDFAAREDLHETLF